MNKTLFKSIREYKKQSIAGAVSRNSGGTDGGSHSSGDGKDHRCWNSQW